MGALHKIHKTIQVRPVHRGDLQCWLSKEHPEWSDKILPQCLSESPVWMIKLGTQVRVTRLLAQHFGFDCQDLRGVRLREKEKCENLDDCISDGDSPEDPAP